MKPGLEIPIHRELGELEVLEYLSLLWPDRSQQAIKALFAAGRVRSGGKPVSMTRSLGEIKDLILAGGLDDVPRIFLGPEKAPASIPIDILHEDERLVALSKPSGLPVVPDREQALESCLGFLIRRELAERPAKPPARYLRYRIVHRIDRLTSGLVLVAKTAGAERRLGEDFEHHRVRKEYLALLAGTVLPARFAVNCPVAPGRKGRMRAEAGAPGRSGKEALTEFEVLERFRRVTLVRALPLTGRTHQIRVHAWAAGHPLAIDPVYHPAPKGGAAIRLPGIDRLTLHAHRTILPETWSEPRAFTCPPPADFQAAIEALRTPNF